MKDLIKKKEELTQQVFQLKEEVQEIKKEKEEEIQKSNEIQKKLK